MPEALPTDPQHRPGDVVHLVLLRLRPGTTAGERAELQRRFLALADSERDGRRYVRSIRGGPQTSPEGAGHGYELGFVVEFGSEGDRNFYLGRPFVGDAAFDERHDAFKTFAGALLDPDGGLLVFDLHAGP